MDGTITVNGTDLKTEGSAIRIQAKRKSLLLVLSGELLNEPT